MSWHFFQHFATNWKDTGAIAPSSPALARRMIKCARIATAASVLELGPGTGAFTCEIERALPSGAHYLGLELNQSFVDRLRRQHPRMQFEAVAAQDFDFDKVLGHDGSFDAIVSGLPWTNFPEWLQIAILDHVLPRLRPGGVFVTFAYTGFHLLPKGQHFRTLLRGRCLELNTSRTVWANLPPAFVYEAVAGKDH
ncbi:MAG TPA: methyltransferase domain-containing protein [Verrucomicrobium sp.]|nr:methyltransferase domain-containing protein [Verrucomicrobium sp.]